MTRLKIALMAGGDSPERGIALQSAAQIEAALDHTKYDITVIDLHHRDWHYTAPDGREWQVDKNDFSLTVEGERDDICSVGQTVAAQDMCKSIRPYMKTHHVQVGVGHYGVFSGRKWNQQIYPRVREVIHASMG